MKGVLLNENLPASLRRILEPLGLSVVHVSDLGLSGRGDGEVWARAVHDGLAVMTKDVDYVDLALARGEGMVVLISAGNLRLRDLKEYVSARTEAIVAFLETDERIIVL
jgi:predicted nuclease of predicted toxin-antitoxin system